MSSLLDKARELRYQLADASDSDRIRGHSRRIGSLEILSLLDEVIPLLEQQNKWAILHAQNVSLKAELERLKSYDEEAKRGIQYADQAEVPPPRIDLYPDAKSEARERRVLAIAQIAAALQADMDYVEAVRLARAILADVEKQEAGK